jgi:ankyrin repeat protein
MPFQPTRALPASPNLEQQKKLARELLDAARAGDAHALERFARAHPRYDERKHALQLSDAQWVIAREYGFASWPRLKATIDSVTEPGPTRPYVTDPGWYEGRAKGLVEMHKGALPNALAQIRAWHPAHADATDTSVAQAAFGLDDARLVYARQNGAPDWATLLARIAGDAGPFAQAFAAIEARDAVQLATLLREHEDLAQARGTNGNTLLNLAAAIERADGPLVRTLLAAGADPNLPNDRGWAPLHQAAAIGDVPLIEALLAAGAVITIAAHGDGGTPLAVALWWGKEEAAARLAREGVVPDNLRVNAGLDRVAELPRFFAADGAPTAEAGQGRGFYRPHSGFPAWTPSDDPAEILNEAMSWAARNGSLNAMAFLQAHGASLDRPAYRGTPLMFACCWYKPRAARWLLEHGADPNVFTPFHGLDAGGTTALHLAAHTDDPDLVRLLLAHGADRTIKDGTFDGDPAGWARYAGAQRTLAVLLESPEGAT